MQPEGMDEKTKILVSPLRSFFHIIYASIVSTSIFDPFKAIPRNIVLVFFLFSILRSNLFDGLEINFLNIMQKYYIYRKGIRIYQLVFHA